MCFSASDRPPLPPIRGAASTGRQITCTAADGTRFTAYIAQAATSNGPGIVILPDIRGLHPYYTDLAERFASQGIHAIAIDYFGRTAGLGIRDDTFDWQTHIPQTKFNQIRDDAATAIAYLRSPDGGNATKIFSVGFCFGGSNSFLLAASNLQLAGAIGFYGRPVGAARNGAPAPIDLVNQMTCPILGLFGGADQAIPQEAVDAFDAALTKANVPHSIHVYPGAPHSFFDRRFTEFADAWTRMLDFINNGIPATAASR